VKGKHEAYSYHVTFNAMHNVVPEDPTKMHAHTFRVSMYVIEKQGDNSIYFDNGKILDEYFKCYKGIRVNELYAFKELTPTIENMGLVFYRELKKIFAENGKQLLSVEVGDSPVFSYCIGDRLLLGSVYNMYDEQKVDEYCQRVRKRYEAKAVKDEYEWMDREVDDAERSDDWVDDSVSDLDIFPYDI